MTHTLPLVAVIAVATVITIGLTGISATTLMTADSSSLAGSAPMVGHVEMILFDELGNIKSYSQGDNIIPNVGNRCTAERLFEEDSPDNAGSKCNSSTTITTIGIGNNTAPSFGAGDSVAILDIASSTGGETSLMSTKAGTADIAAIGGGGIITTITNAGNLFSFVNNVNDTTVNAAYLLDANCTRDDQNTCITSIPADNFEIFALKSVNLVVSGGDTLQVTWQITTGT